MSKPVRIYIEYNVKPLFIKQYEHQMKKVLNQLPTFGADQIKWFKNDKQTYFESFSLPTISHFIALRKLRNIKDHSIFGSLDQFIEGGTQNIQINAIKVE
ncbi:hypothetical protein ACOI1C_17345 [Bacillus sp. DJP31]|uniref:hypothetical protein n=1 Tax=Bacillus sp. DJP31 TaxID=3409789 RepID=UPI003BB7048C